MANPVAGSRSSLTTLFGCYRNLNLGSVPPARPTMIPRPYELTSMAGATGSHHLSRVRMSRTRCLADPRRSADSDRHTEVYGEFLGYTVFISHSIKDRFIARQVADLIETAGREHGIDTFLDEKDIEYGGSIPDEIRQQIRNCGELVVLLSEYSVDRPWVLIEIGAAWVLEKRIVAVMDKLSPDQMPDVIAPYRGVDLNDVQAYVRELVDRIAAGGPHTDKGEIS